MNDLEIAQAHTMRPITEIAGKCRIPLEAIERYGEYKAKVRTDLLPPQKLNSHLVLVTAINPTPAGEGKTTVSVGLADGLRHIGKESVLALREPSVGPVFGMKGGATGGGRSQIVPMEDINLHFTGDLHAITAANNLLAAMIDNHIYQGNALKLDTRTITWRRCMDMNDRQLRHIVSGLDKSGGVPREDGFDITAASEVMAILCLSGDISELRERLSRVIVGYDTDGEPVTAGQLGAHGAMSALLKEAIKPNLVQTLEGTPAFLHGGPFANIAHGCNSVAATKAALSLGEYVITEAGFGADLGCEKFLDIKCRAAGLSPSAVVIVATIRGLKFHGEAKNTDARMDGSANTRTDSQSDALLRGVPNLIKHIENVKSIFNLPVVVAINKFTHDTSEEIELVRAACQPYGSKIIVCDTWENGGTGGAELAAEVVRLCEMTLLCETTRPYTCCYELDIPLKEKIKKVAKRVYGADDVSFDPGVLTRLKKYDAMGKFPICVAKTQYSLSDNPKLLARPEGFTLHVRQVKLSAGAGFVVVFTGDIIAMPGLPKSPAAERIDIDGSGEITGIF